MKDLVRKPESQIESVVLAPRISFVSYVGFLEDISSLEKLKGKRVHFLEMVLRMRAFCSGSNYDYYFT